MIYHKYSIVGAMLWMRYGLGIFKPWRTLTYIYHNYMESPGTKAFSVKEFNAMVSKFKVKNISVALTSHDLLESDAGQRHGGAFLSIARVLLPRRFIRRYMANFGLYLLASLTK